MNEISSKSSLAGVGDPYQSKIVTFCSAEFYVDHRVYVPTRETEQLVQRVAEFLAAPERLNNPLLILDVGTGSGAIGISLARRFSNARVVGLDISEEALQVAEINKKLHGVSNYSARLSNYVSSVSERPDAIVADLPWGSEEFLLGSNSTVDWTQMPQRSLFPADGGPMGCYKGLIGQVAENGWQTKLFIETGVMPEKLVKESLAGFPVRIEYIPIGKGYSVTEVDAG